MLDKKSALFLGSLLCLFPLCQAAINYFDPADGNAIPGRLSQTGVYSSIRNKIPDTALKYFEVNAPLWSDGAIKSRWIVLPPGQHIVYVDSTDLFNYPNGTRFVKLFRHERVANDTSTLVYWETRLLVNKKNAFGDDEWHGFSYKWNSRATEAFLVSPEKGFDTVFYYRPYAASKLQTYKKWHYPSQSQCNLCHQSLRGNSENGPFITRGVLGFFPAQLKRAAPLEPGVDQIAFLFKQGVFTGTPPTRAQLARRWKGIHEFIPAGLAPHRRFTVIDTMARSYIAANCSGCHGTRGAPLTPQIPAGLNYDFFNLHPVMEFARKSTSPWGLQALDSNLAGGRMRYMASIVKAGLDTSAGSVWNMSLPPGRADTLNPALLYPGYPSLSTLPYRIATRSTPWLDSVNERNELSQRDPTGRLAWIFSKPWGSVPWRDMLKRHHLAIDSVISYIYDPQQMPPIASYIPDTAALKILGEWIRNYRAP